MKVGVSALLQNALTVNSTLVGQRQNEYMKRISSWAAILFAVAVMVLIAVGLFMAVKGRKWL